MIYLIAVLSILVFAAVFLLTQVPKFLPVRGNTLRERAKSIRAQLRQHPSARILVSLVLRWRLLPNWRIYSGDSLAMKFTANLLTVLGPIAAISSFYAVLQYLFVDREIAGVDAATTLANLESRIHTLSVQTIPYVNVTFWPQLAIVGIIGTLTLLIPALDRKYAMVYTKRILKVLSRLTMALTMMASVTFFGNHVQGVLRARADELKVTTSNIRTGYREYHQALRQRLADEVIDQVLERQDFADLDDKLVELERQQESANKVLTAHPEFDTEWLRKEVQRTPIIPVVQHERNAPHQAPLDPNGDARPSRQPRKPTNPPPSHQPPVRPVTPPSTGTDVDDLDPRKASLANLEVLKENLRSAERVPRRTATKFNRFVEKVVKPLLEVGTGKLVSVTFEEPLGIFEKSVKAAVSPFSDKFAGLVSKFIQRTEYEAVPADRAVLEITPEIRQIVSQSDPLDGSVSTAVKNTVQKVDNVIEEVQNKVNKRQRDAEIQRLAEERRVSKQLSIAEKQVAPDVPDEPLDCGCR
jgi:hypothetical protein